MFDVFPKLLSSIASFLFPLFASYKALKTSDPAQLTAWLMYWVVLAVALLVESWTEWILVWVPFYAYLRLLFLLYLVLPQTQGARRIYEEYIHPYLEENETQIEEFIASAHDRLKAAGIAYVKRAIELLKTNVLGLPPGEPTPAPPPPASGYSAQTYTQSLLARFSVPSARWAAAGTTGTDFYNLLAGAVSAAAGSVTGTGAGTSASSMSASGTLIPPNVQGRDEKITFIAAQRERLAFVLSALDREARELERQPDAGASNPSSRGQGVSPRPGRSAPRRGYDGADEGEYEDESPTQRPPSGLSGFSALSKSRSEADFEKIDAESGAEDDAALRRRSGAQQGGSWLPWGWAATPTEEARSSGVDRTQ